MYAGPPGSGGFQHCQQGQFLGWFGHYANIYILEETAQKVPRYQFPVCDSAIPWDWNLQNRMVTKIGLCHDTVEVLQKQCPSQGHSLFRIEFWPRGICYMKRPCLFRNISATTMNGKRNPDSPKDRHPWNIKRYMWNHYKISIFIDFCMLFLAWYAWLHLAAPLYARGFDPSQQQQKFTVRKPSETSNSCANIKSGLFFPVSWNWWLPDRRYP